MGYDSPHRYLGLFRISKCRIITTWSKKQCKDPSYNNLPTKVDAELGRTRQKETILLETSQGLCPLGINNTRGLAHKKIYEVCNIP